MAGDLPPGKYTMALIGAWWPQPSSTLRAGAQHWSTLRQQQEQYAHDLHSQWTGLASRNQGHTVDDLVSRLQQGEKHHLDLAEKYNVKADAFERGADAIDGLREGLRGIADDYNQRIANIENSKDSAVTKAAEIEKLIAEANGFAAHKSAATVSTIMDATQKILTAEGLVMSPQEFLQNQGLNAATGGGLPAAGASSGAGHHAGHAESTAAAGVGPGDFKGGASAGPDAKAAGRGFGGTGGGEDRRTGAGGSAPTPAPAAGGHVPGAPGVGSPVHGGGGLPPAAALGGASPNQLGNSFATGMMTGQPAAAGAHKLSEGALNAVGAAPPPQAPIVPSVSAPTMAGGAEPAVLDQGAPAAPAAGVGAPVVQTGGTSVPVAAPVVGGGPVSAPVNPVVGTPASPAGPLPAYGSDLRPPVVAAPSVSAPTAPVSGAPVAPSPSTSPAAGSPLMSTVQRAAAGQAGTSPAAPAGASALSAAAGAVAGDVSGRAAEQQRLQRLVDAVARQAPGLPWAVGLRDDGTTLLVSGIGCGWIPPNVKIPVGVNRLLEPALRRSDASVIDLLGAVTTAAVHNANGFVAKAGPDDPALTGDRMARSGPEVDELGPTLVEAVRRRDGLPRIAQTLAQAATRGTGVTENEMDVLRNEQQSAYQKALEDQHDLARVADWMLLAAVDALIEGHEYLVHYHVAWHEAVSAKA
ncbi:DUF5631 domain-containing protein [Mycobacterium heidelbergense]|nr:DUF5631 domain-containing protein [Mycobacterium heidelbergense]